MRQLTRHLDILFQKVVVIETGSKCKFAVLHLESVLEEAGPRGSMAEQQICRVEKVNLYLYISCIELVYLIRVCVGGADGSKLCFSTSLVCLFTCTPSLGV